MKTTLCFAALLLALPLSARAAYQVAALPALPSMPLSVPTRLPGVANLPKIAPALPSLPMPVIGRPEIALPSPANPMPLLPTVRVSNTVARVSLAAAPAAPAAAPSAKASADKDSLRAEKLERLFDGNDDQVRHEGRNTLPESDLLNEIGIQ